MPRLPGDHMGVADRVEQRGLAVIDMAIMVTMGARGTGAAVFVGRSNRPSSTSIRRRA